MIVWVHVPHCAECYPRLVDSLFFLFFPSSLHFVQFSDHLVASPHALDRAAVSAATESIISSCSSLNSLRRHW